MKKRITAFNEWIAVRATMIFGSMWITYLFFLYGFIPVRFPQYMDKLLYWSNTVQLWSLPLLMVGQNVTGRASEARAQKDHETLMAEFSIVKSIMTNQAEEIAELRSIVESDQQEIAYLRAIAEKLGVDINGRK